MSGKKRIIKLTTRIMESLDLPEEALGKSIKITMLKNEHMLVENHTGIYELFEHNIKISSETGMINIRGDCLTLKEISPQRLYITGCIKGIDVELE